MELSNKDLEFDPAYDLKLIFALVYDLKILCNAYDEFEKSIKSGISRKSCSQVTSS